MKFTPIKNHLKEIQLVTHRSIIAVAIMLLLIFLLILRLAYLQIVQHDLYTTLSQKNALDLIPIEPTRGLIYDRNGVLLAENIPVFSLDVTPYKAINLTKNLAEITKIIQLTDTEIIQFHTQLKQHRRFDEIPLKLRLSEIEVAKFAENAYRFPGFAIKARLIRHYPANTTFSHVLGYVGRINEEELTDLDTTNYSATNYIGKLGIEKFYEEELHGTVGYQQVENDASGEPIRVLNQIKPIHGKNLFLTVDSHLQSAAEKALTGYRGAIVVIQPDTGEVLAIVSQPGYDPNLFVAGISTSDFHHLQNAPDKPLYNRALRGLYPLASTIKPFIALAGLNTKITTANATIFDPGWYKLKNSSHFFHDWRRHGHGIVNLNRAIVSSCDTYFYDLAHRLGIKHIDAILNQFGFGELTGIDLEEELPGVVASPQWKRDTKHLPWYEGDTIISGIGQGYMQSTPLQLAAGIATIANQGLRIVPHLLLVSQDPEKLPAQQFHHYQTIVLNNVNLNDKNYWATVIDAMQGVITSPEGTAGRRFGKAPYSVAGKTGTAQVYSYSIRHRASQDDLEDQSKIPEKLRDHSLFIAFAPINKPKIAIAVIVENSKLAPSIARQVLDSYLITAKNNAGKSDGIHQSS